MTTYGSVRGARREWTKELSWGGGRDGEEGWGGGGVGRRNGRGGERRGRWTGWEQMIQATAKVINANENYDFNFRDFCSGTPRNGDTGPPPC